ncbi:MAG TPA: HAMP domain-containing sensor histidine kinase [Candidatus Binatia bacterium]|nr:HAMP domain-containing sensor histidine kinase [Candidatus Binatia bacterium]
MAAGRHINLLPFTSSRIAQRFGFPLKLSVILIRWPVVIICAYLLLYPSLDLVPQWFSYTAILLYIASNVGLYFFAEERFASWSFYYPLVIADTIFLTLSLVANGYSEKEFYLTFFVVILGSCIIENAKIRTVVSVAAPLFYSVSLFTSASDLHPSVFLRLPFLFVVSLFYGYFTQFIRMERAFVKEEEIRSRGRKEILNIVSHEFRTPLNVIAGYAQALREKTWGDVTSEQKEVLGKILQESDNLTVIINEVLDVTRIEAGELTLRRETFSLSDYLREIQIKFAPSPNSVSVHWLIPDGLPKISTDRATLTIILQHLINNALKFTAKGDIWVTARTAASRQSVEIEVKDTGIGIPREAHHLIFEKFQQLDPSSTRTYGGLGLGLYIVKVFTDLLEGTLKVESEPLHGSTFTLCLPI